MAMTKIDHLSWQEAAEERYGADASAWRFKCPSCGHVCAVADWQAAGAPEGAVAFSCVGRWSGAKGKAFARQGGPCDYTGGGLFKINPVTVRKGDDDHSVFDFADRPLAGEESP